MSADVKQRECYRVADLRIDIGAMLVMRDRKELALPPLSFELLILLVRRAPDVVTQKEILDTIWGDVVVGPPTLKQRVKLLRQALGDNPRDPRYIATVRGRGYRLIPMPQVLSVGWPGRLGDRLRGILDGSSGGGVRKAGIAGLAIMALMATGTGPVDRLVAETPRQDCSEIDDTGPPGRLGIVSDRQADDASAEPATPCRP